MNAYWENVKEFSGTCFHIWSMQLNFGNLLSKTMMRLEKVKCNSLFLKARTGSLLLTPTLLLMQYFPVIMIHFWSILLIAVISIEVATTLIFLNKQGLLSLNNLTSERPSKQFSSEIFKTSLIKQLKKLPYSHSYKLFLNNRKQLIENRNFTVNFNLSMQQKKRQSVSWSNNSHDMRIPVATDISHNKRTSVVMNKFHNMRQPVMTNLFHDLRKPVSVEYSHNMRFPVSTYLLGLLSKTSSELKDIAVCGLQSNYHVPRIIGGFESSILKWPWMISLKRLEGNSYKHKCGAVLLYKLWAISAAHCLIGEKTENIVLHIGEWSMQHRRELYPHVERKVHNIILHPDFNPVTYENDVSLLQFTHEVSFLPNVAPICLPHFKADIKEEIGVVTGWGKLSEDSPLPEYIHEVHIPVLSNKECETMYETAGYVEKISDTFICAGVYNGGLDACEGDSGGPLMMKGQNGQWFLVGLISWGIGCGAPMLPGVYIRITKYAEWIKEITKIP